MIPSTATAATPMTATSADNAPLGGGLDRDEVLGLPGSPTAEIWANYGHSDDDVRGWLEAGVGSPVVAAELRAEGVDPGDMSLRGEVDGQTWARAVDEGHRSVWDFLAFRESGRVV